MGRKLRSKAKDAYYVIKPIPGGCEWFRIVSTALPRKEVALLHVDVPNAANEAARICQLMNQWAWRVEMEEEEKEK